MKRNYILLEAIIKSSKNLRDNLTSIFKEFDLGVTEFGLLEAIHTLGPQPIQVLAKRILITSGSMTYTVNQLINKGYIERKVFELDNRIFFLHLTEKGSKDFEKILLKHDEFLTNFFSEFTEEEKKLISRLLRKLF